MAIIKIFVSDNISNEPKMLTDFSKLLDSSTSPIHMEFLSAKNISSSNRQDKDFRSALKLLGESCMILVNGNSPLTYQTGIEMAVAKMWKIPIYLISNHALHPVNVKESVRSINQDYSWAYELSDHIFPDLPSFGTFLINLCQNHYAMCIDGIGDVEDKIDKLMSFDGGYDEGYSQVSNFWGTHPASLVVQCAALLKNITPGKEICCLDLGCGTGKNAIYLSRQGFKVDAVDASFFAIKEARMLCRDVHWTVGDIRKFSSKEKTYDAVVMTGSLHCLADADEILQVVRNAQEATSRHGYHVLSAFNAGEQDFSGHARSFSPALLAHQDYLDLYNGWNIIENSDLVQEDVHPHNKIPHKHSITRILAQKP